MNQEGRVTTARHDHVLLIGLDRVTKRNAFDIPMLNGLAMAYGELDRDDELRCGVLFAHGEHFYVPPLLRHAYLVLRAKRSRNNTSSLTCNLSYKAKI